MIDAVTVYRPMPGSKRAPYASFDGFLQIARLCDRQTDYGKISYPIFLICKPFSWPWKPFQWLPPYNCKLRRLLSGFQMSFIIGWVVWRNSTASTLDRITADILFCYIAKVYLHIGSPRVQILEICVLEIKIKPMSLYYSIANIFRNYVYYITDLQWYDLFILSKSMLLSFNIKLKCVIQR